MIRDKDGRDNKVKNGSLKEEEVVGCRLTGGTRLGDKSKKAIGVGAVKYCKDFCNVMLVETTYFWWFKK